jgi:erythronate-4-phosphate dehydrogenase
MLKIVADNKIPFLKGALEPYAKVCYLEGSKISVHDLTDADALIIRTRTICSQKLLEGSKVKFIASATIGYDHIDTRYCRQQGISWTNAPGCNSGSVMQYVASALVRLSLKYGFRFRDKTIGIIGYGNVGSKVAKMAKTLGMRVLINDPPLERRGVDLDFSSIEKVKAASDIISFHVPLNFDGIDRTLQMGNMDFFQSLKPTCTIINTSRGEVIDGKALKNALQDKKIKSAVLDVWENEPDIDTNLLDLVDFASPHIAGYSADGKANGTTMSVAAVSGFFGLGIKNWFPAEVPLPDNRDLNIDCKDKSLQDIVSELILNTYDIATDDRNFRQNPSEFEQQRGSYPLRREFYVYRPFLSNPNPETVQAVKELGFGI